MNKKKLYIITGTTNGLGYNLACRLVKSYKVIGISKTKSIIHDKNYFHIFHDFSEQINDNKLDILKKFPDYKIYIILNAAKRFDKYYKENYYKYFKLSLNINLFNQINLLDKLENLFYIEKIITISTYNIFLKKNIRDIGYYISKLYYYRMADSNLAKKRRYICFVIGSMRTRMLNDYPSSFSKIPILNYLINLLTLTTDQVSTKILSNINNDKKLIYIPGIPIFMIKLVIKLHSTFSKF